MESVGYLQLVEEFSLPVCDWMACAFLTGRSKTKRPLFAELTDAEVAALERIVGQKA